jgi:serine/threonine-protein kinase
VYALGVLLYRLLSGHSPWTADTTTQMLTAHIYIDPEPLTSLPGVPDYIVDLCNRCLSKDATQRPSAREAAALLAQGAGLRVVRDDAPARAAGGWPAEGREGSLVLETGTGALTSPAARADREGAPTGPADPSKGTNDAGPGRGQIGAGQGGGTTGAGQDGGKTGAGQDSGRTGAGQGGGKTGAGQGEGKDRADPVERRNGAGPDGRKNSAGPEAGKTGAGPGVSKADADHKRRWWAVAAAIFLVAVATVIWLLVPGDGQDGGGPVAFATGKQAPAGRLPASGAATTAGTGGPVTPPDPAGAPVPGQVPGAVDGTPATAAGAEAPANPGPGVPGAGVPGATPGTTGPVPTATTGDPGPTSTPDQPQERTLTSAGGTVRADCPSASTARLLSWTATKPYRVDQVSAGPAAEAVAAFKRGKVIVRMTVTCTNGTPSTSNEQA